MPLNDALSFAAERNGVQQDFWDIFGHRHFTEPETNRAILTALGLDCTSEDSLRASFDRQEAADNARLLPPVLVVSENEPLRLPGNLKLEIVTEQGIRHCVRIENGVANPALKLPLGYHEARSGDCSMRLIVTPDHAVLPAPGKHAGLGVTLYGLRSRRNWGCGDFRDLEDLVIWASTVLHVDFIALNPLHAIHNRRPYNTSPYLPNSIFYRNFLYLDVEGVRGSPNSGVLVCGCRTVLACGCRRGSCGLRDLGGGDADDKAKPADGQYGQNESEHAVHERELLREKGKKSVPIDGTGSRNSS